MNKQRKTEIQKICESLDNILVRLKDVYRDEEYVFDNIPENLQSSRIGEESEEAIEIMDNCIDKLNEIIDDLEVISWTDV